MSFDKVTEFENIIADYFGSQYAVAVDCCTHAIELCLRIQNIKTTTCPKRTYVSVPMTLKKLEIDWSWNETSWQDYYFFEKTNIIDAAVLWKHKSYIPQTLMCLSFQFHKHLGIGRGGMILLNDLEAKNQLIRMSYDGRDRNVLWVDQNISSMGYHYYMTPEVAQLGIEKFYKIKDQEPKRVGYLDYPDLSVLPVFK